MTLNYPLWVEGAAPIITENHANVGAQNLILEIGSLNYRQAWFVKLAFFSGNRKAVAEREVYIQWSCESHR